MGRHGRTASQRHPKGLTRRDLLRSLGAGAVVLGGGSVLAACNGNGNGNGEGAAEGDPPGDGDIAGASFAFTGWSLVEGASADVIESYVSDFESEQDVSVETQGIPFDEFLDQVLLQASNLDGALQLDAEMLPTVAALGVLRDLSDVAAEAGYTDAGLEMGQVGGTQYGLPWTQGSIGLIANERLLDDAGVSAIPESIEEFEAALEAIRSHDSDLVPYAAMTAIDQLRDIVMWMRTFGSEVIGEDGEILIGDEGSVRAVQWYVDLLDEGLIAPGMGRFDARTLFAQGNVGFYDDAIVAKGILLDEAPNPDELEEALLPVRRPVADGGDSENLFWGHVMAVIDEGDADAAARFAQYMTADREVAIDYFQELALPPTTEDALESDEVQADEFVATWSEELTPTARANPFLAYPEQRPRLQEILGEEVEAALTGGKSPEDAMADAAERMEELVE